MSATRDWDAATYDRVSTPQQTWAAQQLDRLTLAGDEVVLDAGCGSGRVTRELVDRVPDGRVYAVDAAPSMVAHARAALGDAATVLCEDLAELALPEPVDVVFSNATFHWLPDHDALFAALARNCRPGARLVAQCGGIGNVETVRVAARDVIASAPFAPHFADWRSPWNFATPEQTERRLGAAGFVDVRAWLQDAPTPLADGRAFLQTILVRHLDPLPASLHDPFVDAVVARLAQPLVLDYVRLNMIGRLP